MKAPVCQVITDLVKYSEQIEELELFALRKERCHYS
jgi:hypothetical protein